MTEAAPSIVVSRASHRFDNAKRRRPDSHARQAMLTPPYVLEPIRELLGGIGLDPCTEPDNPTGPHVLLPTRRRLHATMGGVHRVLQPTLRAGTRPLGATVH